MSRYKDLTGQRFGRWTVTEERGRDEQKNVIWECRCNCGTIRLLKTSKLTRRAHPSKSCGCLQREVASKRALTHGHSINRSGTYSSWMSMLDRCRNENHKHYSYYGGRGITVCDKWQGENGFINFLEDMGERPIGMTLDRYPDKNGNYELSNCRWATWEEQVLNKRRRFSEEDVRLIRSIKISSVKLSSILSVSSSVIRHIRRRETYADVT